MRKYRWIVLCATSALLLVAHAAVAQTYPVKPIRLVIGFPPGGGIDLSARLLGPRLSQYLGQSILIDNRPGAGTNIANETVAKAAPDGYTLLMNTGAIAINMSLYKGLRFDTLRDFAPVSVFASSPHIMVVSTGMPVKNVQEFVALARAQPGKLNYSSGGSGTTQHLATELLKNLTRIELTHIPYRGGAPALMGLVAGEVQVNLANIKVVAEYVKNGRLRALAQTGNRRSDLMPDVPTMREAGFNMEADVWQGVLAPARTPRPIISLLAETIIKSVNDPDIRKTTGRPGRGSGGQHARSVRQAAAHRGRGLGRGGASLGRHGRRLARRGQVWS